MKTIIAILFFGIILTVTYAFTVSITDHQTQIRLKRQIVSNKIKKQNCNSNSILVGGIGGAATGAVGGAVVGAAAGSIVPVLGTVVGAAFGAAVGFAVGGGGGATAGASVVSDNICAFELSEHILNTDLGIIVDNDKDNLLKEIKKLNQAIQINGLEIEEKSGVSAKITALQQSAYNTNSFVVVKYIVERNLRDTSLLLQDWQVHYTKFLAELQRQLDEDVNSFDMEHKKVWRDDKNFQIRSLLMDLKQNIEIIINDNYIKKLYARVETLENDLTKLKITIEKMQTVSQCAGKASALGSVKSGSNLIQSAHEKVSTFVNLMPKSVAFVPVVGHIFTGLSTLTEVYCFLDKHFLN